MIDRNIDKIIENHYANNKSALLLTGARQVGKTIAFRRYAEKMGMELVEINFHEDQLAKNIFIGAQNAQEVLLRISAHTRTRLVPGKTLIFFDEIQKYADVVTWVKFLVDEGSYRYALSYSGFDDPSRRKPLLPFHREDAPGSLDIQDVYPLTLKEFARAIGVSDAVLSSIREAWEQRKPVDEVVHASMMRVVSLYLLVGGMPAAVQTYIDTNDMQAVRGKQEEILKLYHWDIAQYDPDNKLYLDEIFDLIPTELNAKNKRFILKDLNEHRMFARHENGFIWLKDAGVALPTYNVEEPRVPLKLSELRNLFKLFQNDVGLLAAQYAQEIAMQILTGDVNINYGAIYENFVAQELQAHGWALRYFNSKKQGEVDFVIEEGTKVLPIEVKSGKDYQRHSALTNLLTNKEYGISEALVLNNENTKQKGNVLYVPIYMTMFVEKKRVVGETKYVLDMEGLK